MTPAEYAQTIADYSEMVAKANQLDGAQTFVLVRLPDGDLAFGVGSEDGEGVATPDVLLALIDAAGLVAREGWQVEAITA